jgi:hypothetical protein
LLLLCCILFPDIHYTKFSPCVQDNSRALANAAKIPVGAAEGCDLLILKKTKSKDRSLRQLLRAGRRG